MADARRNSLPVYSVTPFTMLDFPGQTACIVWLSGCNMRCAYCHNPQIVKGKGHETAQNVLSFLEKRRGLLDGIVLSGGEASLWPGLQDFIRRARRMNYKIKLDTNGLRPETIQALMKDDLLDYIALDYKAPLEKFKKVTGTSKFDDFTDTLSILCSQNIVPFEIRTTVHTALMGEEDINSIIADLDRRRYNGVYYVQNFRADNDRPTLGRLPPQPRTLLTGSLAKPQNFTLSFRNFSE